jgi:hypothetical protein
MEPHWGSEEGESSITRIQAMPVPFARPFAIPVLSFPHRFGLELPRRLQHDYECNTSSNHRPRVPRRAQTQIRLLVVSKPARTKRSSVVADLSPESVEPSEAVPFSP